MRYTVMGFNQEQAVEYGLSLTDLILLDYIWRANGSPRMKHITDDEEMPYVWLNHTKLHEDLPILKMTEGTLKNTLSRLKKEGFIQSMTIAEGTRGSRTYYTITEKTYEMQNTNDSTNDSSSHSKMTGSAVSRHSEMTSYNKLNTDNKLNNVVSKDTTRSKASTSKRTLSDMITEYSGKQSKKKGVSLYEKCWYMVTEYTNNEKLRTALGDYLSMRLSMKDKPLQYANQWKGLLNRLSEIATNIPDQIAVVKQSIIKGWANFYEIKSYNNTGSKKYHENIEHTDENENPDDFKSSGIKF